MKNWYKRWMLRRIILALQYSTEHHGLKKEVQAFAGALEATLHMAAGNKHDQQVTITVTKKELSTFIGYMIQLHNAKLSLLTRARIGLVSLLISDKKLMPNGQDPMDFAQEQFSKAKSAKDDKNIIQLNR